jgi:hypothetical protein
MDTQKIRELVTRIQADARAILTELGPPVVIIRAGDNLQAALDKGGAMQLEDGATFTGNFVMHVPGTRVVGPNARIHGPKGGAALFIPPGAKDVQATIGQATCDHDQAVIQVGENDTTQVAVESVPAAIQLTISVPTFRGKRAFAINGANVLLLDCACLDVYDPAGRDSQGVLILNTPGDVTIRRGKFEAGSENILIGGDRTAIPNLDVTDVLIEDVDLSKPLSWMGTDPATGAMYARGVKNNFELKDGVNVILRRAKIDGCWKQGQAGHSMVITPRNGKKIAHVLIEDVTLTNVGQCLNMIGYDDANPSPQAEGITLRRVNGTSKAGAFGTGRFAAWSGGPKNVTIEECTTESPNQVIYSYKGVVWVDGVKQTSLVTAGCRIINNSMAVHTYGVMAPDAYGANWQTCFPDGVISGNTFHGETATQHKRNLPPDNTFTA